VTRNLGPGPAHRSETTSAARPVAATRGRSFGAGGHARPLAGLATVLALAVVVAVAIGLFRGSFTESVPVTVLSERAGLVMNPDAKVKMRGVQVGKVASIETRPDGMAALHLEIDPAQLHLIPSNVNVDIASSTVFGAKFVQLVEPSDPSPQALRSGQILNSEHVTVEINTVFQQLTQVLAKIDPAKLNETLGALSSAFNGRGEQFGKTLTDADALLAKLEPSLPNLARDIEMTAPVAQAYADAAPDLLATADHATNVGDTLVDQQHNLDQFLVSAIGLADAGNDVVGSNRQALTDVLSLLVPTTDTLNEYREALNCSLAGILPFAHAPALPDPGILVSVAFTLGTERYRYPGNLPKVAATGGPHCKDMNLPEIPKEYRAPYLVTDTGANPAQYGNQGILLNSDGLKNALYGPLDGPPRNSSQVGQPG
jgi:phospholipid/cholesterol/gamma-HCH transport system substrate-binding protein